MFINDRASGTHYLVDTGAEVSIIPSSRIAHQSRQDDLNLHAVDGSSIMTCGTQSLTLKLGLRRTFRWIFILADVSHPIIGADFILADVGHPIIGADFLRHFGLLVDMKRSRHLDTITQLHVQGITTRMSSPHPVPNLHHSSSVYDSILAEFPGFIQPCSYDHPAKHTVTHHIVTTGPPVTDRAHRLPLEQLRIAKDALFVTV